MRDLLQTPRPRRRYGEDRTGGQAIIYLADGTARVWPRALPPHRSPCRIDKDKGVHQHRCSEHHADAVRSYRAIARHELRAAEEATGGYDTELAEYWREHPRTTFRDYLIGMKEK